LDSLTREETRLFRSWAQDIGVELADFQIHLLGIHLQELWAWNRKMNLTGFTSRDRILIELFLDSLVASPYLPEKASLLDVGSGAGFPSLPLRISKPQLEIHLMEASARKTSFLREVVRRTRLSGVTVFHGRIEQHNPGLYPQGYDVVTARALAKLPQTLKWCAPYLRSSGMLVTFQGKDFKKAVEESTRVMEEQQLCLDRAVGYQLPGKTLKRHFLIFRRKGTR
jgi:16S rRNA (guanine527-N7)-methyltransferase